MKAVNKPMVNNYLIDLDNAEQLVGVSILGNKNKPNGSPYIDKLVYDRGSGALRPKPPEVKRHSMFGGPSELTNTMFENEKRANKNKNNDKRILIGSSRMANQLRLAKSRKSSDLHVSNESVFDLNESGASGDQTFGSAWGAFADRIKNMDDDTEYMFTKPRTLTFRSSKDYTKTCESLNNYEHRMSTVARAKTESTVLTKGLDVKIEQHFNVEEENTKAQRAAETLEQELLRLRVKHLWDRVRRYVNERIEKQRAKHFAGWGILSQTIQKMNDSRGTRRDLYTRYITHKDPMFNKIRAPDSFVLRVQNIRARMQNEEDVDRRYRRKSRAYSATFARTQSRCSIKQRPHTAQAGLISDQLPRWNI